MRIKILVFVVLATVLAGRAVRAEAGIQCWSIPGLKLQVYEFAGGNCGGVDSKSMKANIGKSTVDARNKPLAEFPTGQKQVLCVYNAACQADGTAPAPEPDDIPQSLLMEKLTSGELKSSVLMCAGTGTYRNGKLVASLCDPPTTCNSQGLFNLDTHYVQIATGKTDAVTGNPTTSEKVQ